MFYKNIEKNKTAFTIRKTKNKTGKLCWCEVIQWAACHQHGGIAKTFC